MLDLGPVESTVGSEVEGDPVNLTTCRGFLRAGDGSTRRERRRTAQLDRLRPSTAILQRAGRLRGPKAAHAACPAAETKTGKRQAATGEPDEKHNENKEQSARAGLHKATELTNS